ncbi:hypothetical protein ACOI1H_22975 [Loktanella sp. DJP18]|uniref:hypothetical protein n=1 Tax=Loktanella sp. DJP18 TaxID=3409788 RepID=UPI003BB70C38
MIKGIYTPEEQALVDKIKHHENELVSITEDLNQRLRDRLTTMAAEPKQDMARQSFLRLALAEIMKMRRVLVRVY